MAVVTAVVAGIVTGKIMAMQVAAPGPETRKKT